MTINNVEILSKLVSTSVASYGELSVADLEDDLKRATTGAGFASVQANNFANNYSLLHQQESTFSGFSASVFEDASGKKVLAIRGTVFGGIGLVTDVIVADGLGIGASGYADSQTDDLYRYWKQLTTTVGDPVTILPMNY